ncbi:MAG: hypothetical protein M1827_006853 [Pycnora praestabilis]|nr:MAG: hypothetical protein M1827_006853 [Pycnora praestabilis]
MANGSSTTTALILNEDSLQSSQLLSSSISSISSSRHGSSQISKTYKQASTLFLTRRLAEALSTLEPIIKPPPALERSGSDDERAELAPVASASRSTRIKVWSLYITLLNAIIELGGEEGKNAFGSQEWRALVVKARDGSIWEDVVRDGYGGVEGDVDSDVVTNLATLLLTHAPTQWHTQSRLEAYLSSSNQPNLDITTSRLQSPSSTTIQRQPSPHSTGTSTPRELNARIKILELYTLHVLPRNDEWDYAREFISMSEILDDERREAFFQALQGLRDEKNMDGEREAEVLKEQQEHLERERKEAETKRAEEEVKAVKEEERSRREKEGQGQGQRGMHRRLSSETDYGIESSHPNGSSSSSSKPRSTKGGTTNPRPSSTSSSKSNKAQLSPTPQSPRSSAAAASKKPSTVKTGVYQRTTAMIAALQRVVLNMAHSMGRNPMALLRMVFFLVGLVLAFGRRDVRERVGRVTARGWEKVAGTVGMGVKVSYI